jgi:hypothetical protein
LGSDECHYVREVIQVDPAGKTFTARSKNLSFANLLNVQEVVQYTPSECFTK